MGHGKQRISLAALLDDPVTELVMKSDGVDRRSLELLFERVALRERPAKGRGGAADFAPAPC